VKSDLRTQNSHSNSRKEQLFTRVEKYHNKQQWKQSHLFLLLLYNYSVVWSAQQCNHSFWLAFTAPKGSTSQCYRVNWLWMRIEHLGQFYRVRPSCKSMSMHTWLLGVLLWFIIVLRPHVIFIRSIKRAITKTSNENYLAFFPWQSHILVVA